MDLIQQLDRSWLRYHITIQNGDYYFQMYTEESTPKENWSTYCDVQDELRMYCYEIDDPCIEHDCISGYVKRVS